MTPVECEFEPEVLAAAIQSGWTPSLREHAAACAICAEVALVAGAFSAAAEEAPGPAALPDSSRVWWLAQVRARREAAQGAGRPITAAQVMAFACAMGLLGACFGATSDWFQTALRRISLGIPSVEAIVVAHGVLFVAGAVLLFLVPAAVFLTLLRD